MRLGLDVGSTTMKCVLLDEQGNLLFSHYQRHYSQIPETALSLLEKMRPLLQDRKCAISISGSAGMGMAQNLHLPFVQEVYATRTAVLKYLPGSNVVIELDESFEIDESENFLWLTMPQIKEFLRFNNYLNIQVRSLVSML